MKKIICLVLTFCMLLSFAPAAFAAPSFEVQKAAFAQSISNQSAFSVEAEGNYAYLSSRDGGVQIFDISDFSNITNTGRLLPDTATVPTDGESVKVYNGNLYVGFNDKIRKYSLADPAAPELKAEAADAQVISFAFWGDYMFTVNNHSGTLIMWNISGDGITEVMRGTNNSALGKHRAVFVEGNKLFAGCPSGIRIFDISQSGISEVNSITIGSADLRHIASNGSYVFITNTGGDMFVIDLAKNLQTLTAGDIVTKNYTSTEFRGLYADGSILYYSTNGGKLVLLDVSDINNPVEIACESNLGQLPGIDVQNGIVYAANRNSGMAIVKIPQLAYLKNVKEAYDSFPISLSGGVILADEYDFYINGTKVKTASAQNGVVGEEIFSLANGTHKIGIAPKDSADITEYTAAVEAKPDLEISLLTESGEALEGLDGVSGAKIKVKNNGKKSFEGAVVAALFEGQSLKAYNAALQSGIAAGAEVEIPLGIDAEKVTAASALKVFAVAEFNSPALVSNVVKILGGEYKDEEKTASTFGSGNLDLNVARVDHGKKSVDIDVFAKSFYAEKAVVSVTKPGGSGFDDLEYIDVVDLSEESGAVGFVFCDSTEKSPFKVKTAVLDLFGGYLTAEDEFSYVGPVTISNILNDLASENNTVQDTENILSSNSDLFRIDMTSSGKYGLLPLEYQTEILKETNQSFSDTEQVKQAFEAAVEAGEALKSLNEAQDADAIKKALESEDTRKLLSVDETVYKNMDDKARGEIAEVIFTAAKGGSPFYSKAAFAERYNGDGVLIYLNGVGYLQMGDALKIFNAAVSDDLKLDLSGNYSLLKDTETQLVYVHKIMERTDFASLAEVKTVFNEAVSTAYSNKLSEEGSASQRPAGGSGGGGGGGGSTVKIAPTTVAGDVGTNTESGEAETSEKFVDLSDAEWSKEAVLSLSDKGIISGYPDGSFMPNAFVTREEFSKMIFCAMGLEKAEGGYSFEDVKKDDWFYDYVAALCETKIINGESETSFGTGKNLTREDLAVIIVRAAEYKSLELGGGSSADFADKDKISDYAEESVNLLAKSGIMVGYDGNFAPQEAVTRAMAAKVIYEFLKL